jgi:membrane-bound metal-dependent hydrolase YbcI (DUF457 family)
MENFCHTFVGGALARAGMDRLTPLGMPTLLVAANLPDIDVITLAWGDLLYLEHHRGVTHGLAGLVVCTIALALVVLLVDRLTRRWRPGAEPCRFGGLLAVSGAGVASHAFLDYTNSYGIRPWLPFDRSWIYGDLAFVVDPWMWLLLGGALFVGAARRPLVTVLWSALFAAFAFAVIWAALRGPAGEIGASAWVWLAGLLMLAIARWRGRDPDASAIARAALAALVVYWGVLWLGHTLAYARLGDLAGAMSDAAPRPVAALPTLMRPDRWRGILATPTSYFVGTVALSGESTAPFEEVPRNLALPATRAALASCPGQVAGYFNRFLYAEVDPAEGGGTTVLLWDARFERRTNPKGVGVTPVQLDPDLRPIDDGRVCPEF